MSEAIIRAKNVNKTYGRVKAVKNLNFEVPPATCFGFLGPNGAGKTTVMKILYGKANPDRTHDTEISVFGYDPRYEELQIKTLSGVVPQEDNLDSELNVIQNLKIFGRFYQITGKTAQQRIDYLLNFMELSEKKKAKIRELSGGMKRRLIIARALLNNPRLLILDEPTTGLDPQVRQLIWDKLRNLKKEGVSILLTTHYMEEAFQLSDSIIIMHKGEKILEGNPRELLKRHIEPHVLEVIDKTSVEKLERFAPDGNFRKEESRERILYYSRSVSLLQKMAGELAAGEYYLRQVNLEDLFLKATGRELNELQ